MKKLLVFLSMILLFLVMNGEKLTVLSELTNPSILKSDGERLFVLDGYKVFVYSMKDYKLLYEFGKRGEGPGELLASSDVPLTMALNGNQLIVNSHNKMVYFQKNGKYIKELKIPFFAFNILPFGENFAVTKFLRKKDGSSTINVNLCDKNLKMVKVIYSSTLLNDQGKGKIAYPLLSTNIWCSDKKLYVFDQLKDFIIDIYDLSGNKIKTIKKDYKKIKIDKAYKKEKLEWFKIQPAFKEAPDRIRDMVYFLDYLPSIDNFSISNQKIFVQTSKIKDGKAEFIILNNNGETEKTLMLPNARIEAIRPSPITNYLFINNNYYYLTDIEEEWELNRIKLN